MREPLPISRIRLNPDVYLISGERAPMINGLSEPYYLHRGRGNVGIITDGNRAEIGTITPFGEKYWYESLTERLWESPIAAAHTYLLALAPEPYVPKEPTKTTPQQTGYDWGSLRSELCTLLTITGIEDYMKVSLRRAIRQIDAITGKDE